MRCADRDATEPAERFAQTAIAFDHQQGQSEHAPPGLPFGRRVVTFGETRQELKSKPMTERPNRPLHVYGNTVRRRAHR